MKRGLAQFLLLVFVASAASDSKDYGEAVINFFQQVGSKSCTWPAKRPQEWPFVGPLKIDAFNFTHVKGSDTNIVGTLNHLYISGLTNFQVVSSEYDASAMNHIFDIIFGSTEIYGSLDLKGILGVAGFEMHLDEEILINVKLTDLRIMANYTFGQSLSNPDGLRISDLDMKSFIGDIKFDNWDKSLSVPFNAFVNNFFGSLSVLLSKESQPYLLGMIDDLLQINKILSLVNMTRLIEVIDSGTKFIEELDCSGREK